MCMAQTIERRGVLLLKKTTNKLLASILVLVLMLSMIVPISVSAETTSMAGQTKEYLTDSEATYDNTTNTISHFNEAEDVKIISEAGSARISYEFKASSAPGVIYGMVSYNVTSGVNQYIHFYLKPSAVGVEIRNNNSPKKDYNVAAQNLYDGNWHKVTFEVIENQYYAFYLDDELLGKEDSSSTLFAKNLGVDITRFSIGGTNRGSDNDWTFNGSIRNVKVENLDVPPAESLLEYSKNTPKEGDADVIKGLTSGAIAVMFKNTDDVNSLFGLSDGTKTEALYVDSANAKVGFGTPDSKAEIPADAVRTADKTQWHSLIANFANGKINFYLDGTKVAGEAVHDGMFTIANPTDVVINPAVTNVTIYSGNLGEADILKYAGATKSSVISADYADVIEDRGYFYNFKRQSVMQMDDEKSGAYRIPALVQAGNVTIAAIDERKGGSGDQGNIDLQVRRSLDNGDTWLPAETLSNFGKPIGVTPGGRQALHIDPCLAYDEKNDTVYLVVDMFPESSAAMNMSLHADGSGYFDAELADGTTLRMQALNTVKNGGAGNKLYGLVQDRDENGKVLPGATVYEQNAEGKYVVSQTYYVSNYANGQLMKAPNNDGNYTEDAGFIYIYSTDSKGEIAITSTMYVWMYESHDKGETWSNPLNITGFEDSKKDWMRFFGTAPGSGIVIDGGKYDGRIVFPCYFTNNAGVGLSSQSSAVLYSDDHGVTWHCGNSLNEIRLDDGDIQTFQGGNQTTENAVIQVSKDGKLRMYCRNTGGRGKVVTGVSYDGGQNWVTPDTQNPTPVEVDKTELQSKKTEAEAALADVKTDAKKAAINAALATAQTVLADEDATQEEVDEAVAALVEALAMDDTPPAPQFKLGDVDHSDVVDAADATLVLQRYADIIGDDYEGYDATLADVNYDNKADASDATLILQLYAGIIADFGNAPEGELPSQDDKIELSASTSGFPDSCYEPITEVYCQLSSLTYHDDINDKYYVLIVNSFGPGRTNMCVHIRELDYNTGEYAEGSEWITKKIGDSDEAYSAVTKLADGNIGIFWECTRINARYYDIPFQAFTIDYLLSGEQLWANETLSVSKEIVDAQGNAVAVSGAGDTLRFTLTTHDAVFVKGDAVIDVNIGGNPSTSYNAVPRVTGGTVRQAHYAGGSGSTKLVFEYTLTDEDTGNIYADTLIKAYGEGSVVENVFGATFTTMSQRYMPMGKVGISADTADFDIPLEKVTSATAGAQQSDEPAGNVIDNDTATKWHSPYANNAPTSTVEQNWIQLNFSEAQSITGIRYLPRTDSSGNGKFTEYRVLVSKNGTDFTEVATGQWSTANEWKIAEFAKQDGVVAVRVQALQSVAGFASCAELRAFNFTK